MPRPQTDLLKGLTDDEAARVMALGTPLVLAAGDVLFRLGEPAERMFLIRSGRIHLSLPVAIRGKDEDVLLIEEPVSPARRWAGPGWSPPIGSR